jgi:putative sigma-54 modulation protein
MQLDITGRHIEVTPALREFAEEKLSKLERLLDGPLEVHVVLGIEKHRHVAEIQVKSRTGVFSGTQETGDLYASIGEVVDKLERQALKHKEKMRTHRIKKGPRSPEAAAVMAASAAPEVVGDRSVDEERAPRIVRSASYRIKPLSAEDAVLELEGSSEDVLVFRDSETDGVHVVYRQKDGNFGLVEPEF